MSLIDALIVGAFVVYAVWSGFSAQSRASSSLEEYFLAGRSLSGTAAGLSMAATQFAADTPLLVTGLIATAGVFSLWRLWIYALAFLLMGFVLAPAWRRAAVLTDAELTEFRYGSGAAATLRGIKAIYLGAVFNCTVLAMVLWAAKEIAEPFLVWNEWLSPAIYDPLRTVVETMGVRFARDGDAVWIRSTNNILSIGSLVLLTTLYSTTGGLRSVVRTDIVQFGLMMLGTLAYAIWVVAEVGGLGALHSRIQVAFAGGGPGGITAAQVLAFTPDHAREAGFSVIAVLLLQWLVQMNADGTGYLAQRSMACRSDADATWAAVVFTVAQVFVRSLLWLPIGLGLLVLYPPDPSLGLAALTADREATFVLGIKDLLPPGIKGLMITGMLAALASTVDTHLNWGSSYFTNDIYKRFVCRAWLQRKASDRELVWVARVANVLILLGALAIMTQLSSIQTAWQTSLLLGAGLGVVLVLRWLWWRINAWGELSTIIASFVLAPVLLHVLPQNEAWRLLLMALGATVTGVVVSLAVGPEARDRLAIFYERTRAPGFWGPIAESVGETASEPARRLGRGLLAMGLSALSIFALLTGFGTWLVGSPPPFWLPHRAGWVVLLLVTGLASALVFFRLGLARTSAAPVPPPLSGSGGSQ
jgi:SSS family solute:Na+ symporter